MTKHDPEVAIETALVALENYLLTRVQTMQPVAATRIFDAAQSDITAACRALVLRGVLKPQKSNPNVYDKCTPRELRRPRYGGAQVLDAMIEAFLQSPAACLSHAQGAPFVPASYEHEVLRSLSALGMATPLDADRFVWTETLAPRMRFWGHW